MSSASSIVDSGLRPAIDKIEDLVNAAKPLTVKTVFDDRSHRKLLVKTDGSSVEVIRPPALHEETLQTPAELAAFINFVLPNAVAKGDVLDEGTPGSGPIVDVDMGAVMVSDTAVVYAYAFADRQETARVPLVRSKQYAWLLDNDDKGVKQVPLEKALRITFKENGVAALHAAVKNLKFTTDTTSEGTIADRGSSFSRNVDRKVTGVDELPPNVALRFSLFDNFPFTVTIDCSVAADVTNETIVLTAYPASLLNAQTQTFDAIKNLYKVPAFAGRF